MLDAGLYQHPTSNILLLKLRVDGAERKGAGEAGRNDGSARVAGWVAVAAGADLLAGAAVDEDVVDHVVGSGGDSARNVIVIQKVAHLPGDDVIGAGGVAADTQSADELLAGLLVEGQSAAEDVDTADDLAHQRIVRLPELLGGPGVRVRCLDRVAELQA